MKVLDLHLIQNHPVNCLNRDDNNTPKSAYIGGVRRARQSSQSWKRSVRELMKEIAPNYFSSIRTRYIVPLFRKILIEDFNMQDKPANIVAMLGARCLADLDTKDPERTKVIMYLDPGEFKDVVQAWLDTPYFKDWLVSKQADAWYELVTKDNKNVNLDIYNKEKSLEYKYKNKKGKSETLKLSTLKKFFKTSSLKEGIDIQLFGRFIASNEDLEVTASSMFGHVISTHSVDPETDFFTAVDEARDFNVKGGAAMAGSSEFNSATFYKFVSVNISDFMGSSLLKDFSVEEKKQMLKIFIESVLFAIPSAKKSSMNSSTLPSYVLGTVRDKSREVNLFDAFEKPIVSNNYDEDSGGYLTPSAAALQNHYVTIRDRGWFSFSDTKVAADFTTLDLDAVEDVARITNIKNFIDTLVEHV